MTPPRSIALLGGTGPEGRGLAARWSRAGVEVVLGSRDAARAEAAAAEVGGLSGRPVAGATNAEAAARAEVAVLTTPYDGLEATLEACRGGLRGKLVVSAVIPLLRDAHGIGMIPITEGSAAAVAARLLPESRVGAAFHSISAPNLVNLEHELDEDVPVAADDPADRTVMVAMSEALGARGVEVGGLRLAGYLEGFTVVLISLNRLRKARAGLRFSGLPPA